MTRIFRTIGSATFLLSTLLTTTALAQTTPLAGDIKQDRLDIKADVQDIKRDRQDLQRDLRDLQADQQDLRQDLRSGASSEIIRADRREIWLDKIDSAAIPAQVLNTSIFDCHRNRA